jgi:hypothetical protein
MCPIRPHRWPAAVVAALCAAATLAAHPAAAQGFTWTAQGPIAPISRIENAMVYDSGNQRMAMFGGYDLNFNRTNDMWEYNGSARVWANVTPASGAIPSPRQGAAMAYDPARQRILMFGGSDDAGTVLGDTWEWSTTAKTWTLLAPSPAPAARVGSRMVFDTANDRIVLHGGWNSSTSSFFSDTWAWNPTNRTWSNLGSGFSGAFSPRTYHGFVYNTTNNRVTIFGGRAAAADLNDLWELQGNTWVNIPAGGPPPGRGWSGVTYESANSRLVLYGGFSVPGGFSFQDTWAWNGSTWAQLPDGPTPRDSHQMVWDPNRGVSVVFGGSANDVRELAGSTWSGAFNQVNWPPAQDEHSIAFDLVPGGSHARIFLYGGGDTRVWETFANSPPFTLGWRSPWIPSPGPGPGGRIGHAIVHEGPARDRVVLFGGRERTNGTLGPTVFGDTWAFTRTPGVGTLTWNSLPGGPPARYDHQMVYDTLRDRIVMFGGRNASGTALGDTWIWNGSSWSSGPGGPSARFDHAMAYDNVRNVVVLFGGDDGSQKLGDTWEWDGTSWSQRATSGPPARSGAALSSFPNSGACGGNILLFGGRAQSAALLNDHWVWNGTSWGNVTVPGSKPSPRVNARMLYDGNEAMLWLFGGLTATGRSGELWTASISGGSGSGTFSVNDVSVAEGNSGTTNATFTVSLSPPQSTPASVSFATANGSATAGSDYSTTSGSLSFAACQGSQTVNVPVIGDTVDEPDETFVLNLSAPSGATISDPTGQGTILDDDPAPQVFISDCAVSEGNSGTANCSFAVTLSSASSATVTVNYATASNTAVAGSDFNAASGTVTFPPLTTGPQTVDVAVIGDVVDEPDETFVVNLSSPAGATLGDAQGLGTIVDDDAAPQISIGDCAQAEGQFGSTSCTFNVTLSNPKSTTVTVNYATSNGTAIAGSDYTTVSGTVTFPALSTAQTVSVPVLGDLVDEPDETYTVTLSSPSGGTIGDGQGLGTIVDDDPTPEVIVEDCAVAEGNSGTASCTFNLSLSNASSSTVSLNFATADGSATVAGSDYFANSGSVTFPALSTGPQTVTVLVRGDTALEGDEGFFLNLSAPSGATLPDPQGVGTILDDDAPSLSGNELTHGSNELHNLGPGTGPAPGQNVFRIAQRPRSSYEVLVDATSGDIGPGLFLERLSSENVTVVQTGSPVGTGQSVALRWQNTLAGTVVGQSIRVRSNGCTASCGADDVYKIRFSDTTYTVPRFNNSASQVTVLIVQNRTNATVSGNVYFWSAAGSLLYIQPLSLAARTTLILNAAAITALAGRSGSITIAHDGGYGALAGKAVALEPATGFSFDSVMAPRP